MTTADVVDARSLLERANRARQKSEALRVQLGYARRVVQFWEALAADVADDCWAASLLRLRREAATLSCAGQDEPGFLDALGADLEARARANAATFASAFPAALADAGLSLDADARHPRYTLHDGFLHVDVDEALLTATVTPRDGTAISLGMDVAPLVTMLRRESDRLFGRPAEPEQLLQRLYDAYRALTEDAGQQEGDDVPLRRLLSRLSAEHHRFAADEFNVDLARLVQSGQVEVDGRRLHLKPTRNARQGMLLHGLESGGYAGFLGFQRETPR